MKVKLVFLLVCLILIFLILPVYHVQAETLEEYKERIKREQEEAERKRKEEEKKKEKKDDSDSNSGCNFLSGCCQVMGESGCFEQILGGLFGGLFELIGTVRFADYPYASNHDFDFATAVTPPTKGQPPAEEQIAKFAIFEVSVDGSYLFGQELAMYDVQGMLNMELFVLHINLFYQRLWDAQGTGLNTFSANAGFSIPVQNFMLSFYGGIFWQDGFNVLASFGASMKIFFPANIILSLYSLFSVYDVFYFIIFSPTLEVALDRFTIGVGFNVYNYNHLVLYGPTLKLAVWF